MTVYRRLAVIIALVLAANFGVWAIVNQSVFERPWGGVINGLSYSGWREGHNTNHLSDGDIEKQMAALEGRTASVRIYGARDGLDHVIPIAAQHNINVNL